MLVTDFEFAGQTASSWGLMPCTFNSSGTETISNGSRLEFVTAHPAMSDTWHFVASKYSEVLTGTLQVTKKNCSGIYTDSFFTFEELRAITRWLNRKDGYHPLKLTIDDMPGYEDVVFNSYINVSVIELNGQIVGLELSITTDKPYGYFAERTITFELNESNNYRSVVFDPSDEVGKIYPVFYIRFPNGQPDVDTQIDHYYQDSNANMRTESAIIRTADMYDLYGDGIILDSQRHLIYFNDGHYTPVHPMHFNFTWLSLSNSIESNVNAFISNEVDLEITITYSPIAKVGLI